MLTTLQLQLRPLAGLFSVLLLAATSLASGCSEGSRDNASAATSNSQQKKLKEYAVRDLHESKFSNANTKTGLCDKVTDESYDATFGTASPEISEGQKRILPAVVVRHRYTCVMNALAQKEASEQWAILALDEEFDSLRCLRTGPPGIIVGIYQSCGFEPANGKLPFPPPEQIEELWRPTM